MNWKHLYTSMDGRINRRNFWIGTLILVVIGVVLSLILAPVFGVGMMITDPAASRSGGWFSLLMFVIFVWPGAALLIKRRHDRGGSGNDVWAFYGLQIVNTVFQIIGIGVVVGILSLVTFVFAIYLLVVCGFLKGDSGANAYGPDPLAAAA